MYGNQPDRWDDALAGIDRLRVVINAMTRLRICTPDGRMEFSHKGELEDVPKGFIPWFEVPKRRSAGTTIVCGHWSALGLRTKKNLFALDTGCLWGPSFGGAADDRKVFRCRAGNWPKGADRGSAWAGRARRQSPRASTASSRRTPSASMAAGKTPQ
jgi:bis(5'-nucleosyl)-tetraphosphatase (symmetrical)